MRDQSWADGLNRTQRQTLAKKLARADDSFSAAARVPGKGRRSMHKLNEAAMEMGELRLDVTNG